MHTTSQTLLSRLHGSGDQDAWQRFVRLYTPLLFHWARRAGLQEADAADLVQDVFAVLVRKLPEFQYDTGGSFRNWLRTVTLNKLRERWRRPGARTLIDAAAVADVAEAGPSEVFEDEDYRRALVARALQLIRGEFSELTWRAFERYVVAGRDAAEVATELGVRLGTVYAAKSRVVTRLRLEVQGLLD